MNVYNVLDFGAVGDGVTNDMNAIQSAIDAAEKNGGGVVSLPTGKTFLSGAFSIKSNIEFRVERGAILLSSWQEVDFPHRAFSEGYEIHKRVWIRAYKANNIRITGGGMIHGNALKFATEEETYGFKTLVWRPAMTCFIECDNIQVDGITFKDSANWTLHFTGCNDVVVDRVTILNNLKFPNCDGIDPDHCKNVRISNCHIEAADDCIVLKNTRAFKHLGDTESVVVTNCTLVSTSCAIKIGSESCNSFKRCIFSNIVITASNRGLGIQLRDEGSVEDIIFSNIIIETRRFEGMWWGVAEPIYVTALPRTPETKPGYLKNVLFQNIKCRSENGIYIHGCAESRPDGIVFDNVHLHVHKWSKWHGGLQDPRPCYMDVAFGGEERIGEPTPWGQQVRGNNPAIFIYKAGSITLRDTDVTWGNEPPPYFTHAVEAIDVNDLLLDNFNAAAAHENLQAIKRS